MGKRKKKQPENAKKTFERPSEISENYWLRALNEYKKSLVEVSCDSKFIKDDLLILISLVLLVDK